MATNWKRTYFVATKSKAGDISAEIFADRKAAAERYEKANADWIAGDVKDFKIAPVGRGIAGRSDAAAVIVATLKDAKW